MSGQVHNIKEKREVRVRGRERRRRKGVGRKRKKKVFLFIFEGGALLRLLLCSLSLLVFGILLEIKEDSVEVI